MKLKRTRKERTCKKCGAYIAKGDLYAQSTITISGKPEEADLKDYEREYPVTFIERISIKQDICQACANQ